MTDHNDTSNDEEDLARREALVAEAEELLDDVFVGVLRTIKTKVESGNLSGAEITAMSRFLSDNGISIETYRSSFKSEADDLADTLDSLDIDLPDDVIPFDPGAPQVGSKAR